MAMAPSRSSLLIRKYFNIINRNLHTTKSTWIRGRRIEHTVPNPAYSYTVNKPASEKPATPVINAQHLCSHKELLDGSMSDQAHNNSKLDFFKGNPFFRCKNLHESKTVEKLEVLTKHSYVFLFPDFQYITVGICKQAFDELEEVRKMFAAASDILEVDIGKLILSGPNEKLSQLQYLQPASILVSLALIESAKEKRWGLLDECVEMASYGMGDLTALVIAGVISFEDAIRLSHIRGQLMEEACSMTDSGLMIIGIGPTTKLDLALEMAKKICRNKGITEPICTIAAYLNGNNRLIGGDVAALNVIERCAPDFGIHSTHRLKKAKGAYYTRFMDPIIDDYCQAVNKVPMNESKIPIRCSYDPRISKRHVPFRKWMVEGLISPVKWEQALHKMYRRSKGSHFPFSYMFGPGSIYMNSLYEINNQAARNATMLNK